MGGFWSDQQINSQKSVISAAVSSVLTYDFYEYKYITSDFHILFFHLVSCCCETITTAANVRNF